MEMEKEEKKELKEMLNFLQVECSDDPLELKERLARVATYHSRLSFLLVEAKKTLRAKKTSEIKETIIAIAKEAHLSAKVQNTLLDSICEEEQYEVDILERLQASCVHDIDACRSVLSYQKQELNNINLHQI